MANKAQLLEVAEAEGLDVSEDNTKAEIQDALDAAGIRVVIKETANEVAAGNAPEALQLGSGVPTEYPWDSEADHTAEERLDRIENTLSLLLSGQQGSAIASFNVER